MMAGRSSRTSRERSERGGFGKGERSGTRATTRPSKKVDKENRRSRDSSLSSVERERKSRDRRRRPLGGVPRSKGSEGRANREASLSHSTDRFWRREGREDQQAQYVSRARHGSPDKHKQRTVDERRLASSSSIRSESEAGYKRSLSRRRYGSRLERDETRGRQDRDRRGKTSVERTRREYRKRRRDRSRTGDRRSESSRNSKVNKHTGRFRRSRTHSRQRSRSAGRQKPKHSAIHRSWRFDSPPRVGHQEESPVFSWKNLELSSGGLMNNAGPPPPAPSSAEWQTNMGATIGTDLNATKAAREIYISNLPKDVTDEELVAYLNNAMRAVHGTVLPGDPITKCWLNQEDGCAFVEIRIMEEASNILLLTGLRMKDKILDITRPSTYPPEFASIAPVPTIAPPDPQLLGMGLEKLLEESQSLVSQPVTEAINIEKLVPQRLCLFDFPMDMEDQQIRPLLAKYGKIVQFELLKDAHHRNIGVATVMFECIADQQEALRSFPKETGFKLMIAETAAASDLLSREAKILLTPGDSMTRHQVPTRCIMMTNLVNRFDLLDEYDYREIIQDVRSECQQHDEVLAMEIPEPIRGFENEADEKLKQDILVQETQKGVGYAFVFYRTVQGAARARKRLSGRKFAGKVIETDYFSEKKFIAQNFVNPVPNFDKDQTVDIPNPFPNNVLATFQQ